MKKNIPNFQTIEEEAKFWEETNTTDYNFESEEWINSPKKPVTIRLNEGYIDLAKQLAERLGMGYQTLLRSWIAERLLKEAHKSQK